MEMKSIKSGTTSGDSRSGFRHCAPAVNGPRSLFTPDENTQFSARGDTASGGLPVSFNCPVIAHRAGALWAPSLTRPAQSQEAKLAYDNARCHNA